MPKLLTIKEVAEYLAVSIDTVRRLIHKGQLPASKVGGQWRIDKDTLELYLKKKASFVGDVAIHQLYFKEAVLGIYYDKLDIYYIQMSGTHGRLGKKKDRYEKQVKISYMGKEPLPPDKFPEINFWKVKLRNGDFAVMVEPKAFYKMPDEEQAKWMPYSILNPSI
ncbi:MAG: helix-turn-helix domain-containing protein [Planctomycetota bacterium]